MRGNAIALLKELGVKSHKEARKQNLMPLLPFLKTENNNCFVTSVQEYQDLTKDKGSDTKKSATTNHALPHFSYKRALLKAFGEFGVYKAEPSLVGPCSKPFSVSDSNVFILFGLSCALGTQIWVLVAILLFALVFNHLCPDGSCSSAFSL